MTPIAANLLIDALKWRYATKRFDREILFEETSPLTSRQRTRWRRAMRKPGRPRIGKGVDRVLISVEKDLLRQADELAKSSGLNRSELISALLRSILKNRPRTAA